MSQQIERRDFLKASGAAAVILGYSRSAGAWVTGGSASFDRVPSLDGVLLTDQASRDAKQTDLGNIIFNTPAAVLRPASISDISKMIRFCAERGIVVAARGQGHATHGQAQSAGLLIDMSSMQAIHEIGDGYAVVDGGCTWRILTEHSLPQQTPPVLTGFIGLSIGGTLSMAGISGMAYDKGTQVQQVYELTVVTGTGRVVVCSESKNRKLFDHVLSGLGQCGIIVQAKVKLVPAKALAMNITMLYADVNTFMADMRTLVYRHELDSIYGLNVVVDPSTGARMWLMNLAIFHDPSSPPDVAHLTRDLSYIPPTFGASDLPYLDYQLQVDGLIGFLRSINLFDNVMHPWFDVFMPDSTVTGYMADTLASCGPDDIGQFGFVLVFPLLTSTITRPLFRLPDEELVWLFDILTARDVPGYDADFAANKRARNNAWFDMARSLGGTRYPIGSLDFTPGDWRRHYGEAWRGFKQAKTEFDPEGILTPGPGIFPKGC